MTRTVKLVPTSTFPVRVATLVRVDRGSPVIGSLEVREEHPPPHGAVVSRFSVHEEPGAPGSAGDRTFRMSRPNFVTADDWACLPADPREFPVCTCKKWRESAWCVHVECLTALQSEHVLETGKK